jgi:hypothetical protein
VSCNLALASAVLFYVAFFAIGVVSNLLLVTLVALKLRFP